MTTIRIERLAHGGDGIGYLDDGRVVFVRRGVPGDLVEIAVIKSKKRWARGRIVELLEPSEDRIAPACIHFDECGGCSFQHMRYAAEFDGKANAALESFTRLSGVTPPDPTLHRANQETRYRIRARLKGKKGHLGYVAAGTHRTFSLTQCNVLDPTIEAVLEPLGALLRNCNGEVEVETAGAGEVVVTVHARGTREWADKVAAIEGVRGVAFVDNGLRSGRYEVDANVVLGVAFDGPLQPARFRQANGPMTSVLRELVRQRLGDGGHLVEFFAGSGSFTFALADDFAAIDAFEFDAKACKVGREIAEALELAHVNFIARDLEEATVRIPDRATVLLDPPRTGAAALCAQLASSTASRVVYVSCDVATLARDTKALDEAGFQIESLDLVDMFPRTAHIEAVATLTRPS